MTTDKKQIEILDKFSELQRELGKLKPNECIRILDKFLRELKRD